jgi:pimeloyl-ACP methyl ester carboxylesterase
MTPTLVLLHAFPLDSSMYEDVAKAIDVDVMTPDLPGFGMADLLTDEPSLDRYADVVASLLDQQGIGDIVLGGTVGTGAPGLLEHVTEARVGRHPEVIEDAAPGRHALHAATFPPTLRPFDAMPAFLQLRRVIATYEAYAGANTRQSSTRKLGARLSPHPIALVDRFAKSRGWLF